MPHIQTPCLGSILDKHIQYKTRDADYRLAYRKCSIVVIIEKNGENLLVYPNSIPVSASTLAGVKLFQKLPQKDRTEIARSCRGRVFPAGYRIVSQKDQSRDVFYIISGNVRATYFSDSGKEVSFREQYAGEMFGELSAIDGQNRSADIIALTDVTLAIMKPTDFKNMLQTNMYLAIEVMRHLTNLVRLLSDRVIEFSAMGVKNRIRAEILRLGRRATIVNSKRIINPYPTHIDLASRVSTHREAVTRELRVLEEKGIIKRYQDHWVMLDIEQLQKMLDDDTGK